LSRRAGRESALKALFQIDVGKCDWDLSVENTVVADGLSSADAAYCRELVRGVLANRKAIDELISSYAIDWTLDRMANVDRNILRIAVFESIYQHLVPVGVAINEAVELAKVYGDEESSKFVNGVLGAIARSEVGEKH
jgi:N utilization substance protein B